jgi:hypothetical protein
LRQATTSQLGGPSIVPKVRQDLVERLVEVDHERAVILQALAVLDRALHGPARRAPRSRAAVLIAVREEPGVRASMLGLSLGMPVDRVSMFLRDLEAAALVKRTGLGWSPVVASLARMA